MYDFEYSCSAELCEKMSQECDTAILAFSTGKDSLAAWLQMRKYFKRIIPYYCYIVPEMEFVDKTLAYYEDFFGCRIYRFPHSGFFKYLREVMFQYPYRFNRILPFDLPDKNEYTEKTIVDMIQYTEDLPECCFAGNGVRMADSPLRRMSTIKHGAINFNMKRFMPIYDWKKADLLREFEAAGVKLPVDYKIWGRTFDGLDYRFVKPLKDNFPKDYEKLLDWYPLAELEIVRRDGIETMIHNNREELFNE